MAAVRQGRLLPSSSLFMVTLLCLVVSFISSSEAALQAQDVTVPFWEPLPFAELPKLLTTKAVFHQDNSTQGKVYTVLGSDDPDGSQLIVTSDVYEMNVATETWRYVPAGGDNVTGRVYHAADVLTHPTTKKSYIVTYGGYKPEPVLVAITIQDFAVLDLETFTWTSKGQDVAVDVLGVYSYPDKTCCPTCDRTACPLDRGTPSGVVFNYDRSKWYLLGGQSALAGLLSDLWLYDIATDSWTEQTVLNPPSQSRIAPAVVALSHTPKKRILSCGGYWPDTSTVPATPRYVGSELLMLEEISSGVWNWTLIFPSTGPGPTSRGNPLFTIVNTLFIVWGGEFLPTTKALAGPMYALDTNNTDWTQWQWGTIDIADGQFEPSGRAGSGLVYVPTQGAMTSVGGTSTTGASTKDLFKFHALGLLPPVIRLITDVPDGYDFNGDDDSVAIFPDTSPNLFFNPRNVGVITDSIMGAFFGRLVELDESNQEVQELLLPSSEFVVGYELLDTFSNTKVTVFTRHATNTSVTGVVNNAVSVRFEFYQFKVDTVVSNPPAPSVTVKAGDLKFNVRLGGWPFKSSTNTLRLEMGLTFNLTAAGVTASSILGTDLNYLFEYASGTQVQFSAVASSINDNTTLAPVNVTVTGSAKQFSLAFTFQSFASTLFYDPSFGVLVDGSDSGGDGDGTDNTAIYVGVFVSFGVVTILFLIAIVVAVVMTVLYRRRLLIKSRGMTSAMNATSVDDLNPD